MKKAYDFRNFSEIFLFCNVICVRVNSFFRSHNFFFCSRFISQLTRVFSIFLSFHIDIEMLSELFNEIIPKSNSSEYPCIITKYLSYNELFVYFEKYRVCV